MWFLLDFFVNLAKVVRGDFPFIGCTDCGKNAL